VSVYTVGLLTIVLIGSALPYVAVLVIAAASGAANPPLAVLVRGRWSNHLVRRENLTRAFAWETALEGVGWVIGPLLGSGLISFLGPRPTVACALLFTVAGTIWFALLDSAPRGRGAGPTSRGRLPLPSREVRHRILSFVAIGGMLGSVDLGLVAYGLAWNRNLAGVFLTAFAVGGAVGSLTAGAATSHVSTVRRLRLAGLCTVVSMIALILASTPLTVAGAATLGGASLTPFMSLTYAALGEAVSEQLVSEAVGWAAGGVGLGISGGTVVAGWILDGNARSAVFGFAAALGVLVLVLGYLSTRRQRAELGS
jgi:MFS family permease